MDNSKKKIIKSTIKQKILFRKAFCWFLIKSGLSNRGLFDRQIELIIYKKLKRKYYKNICLSDSDLNHTECIDNSEYNIWFCWLQGIENMPPLVKVCYESLKKNTDKNIVFVDGENFTEYAHIPQFIIDKWKKGIITNTHFSDLLRLYLLVENGGLWVDSTVFFTGEIPEYVFDNNLFVYSHLHRGDKVVTTNNWFIFARKNEVILSTLLNILTKYWQKKDFAIHYFIFHMFFTMILEKYPDLNNEFSYYPDINPHLLSYEIFDKYNKDRMKYICSQSTIHKLSNRYKFPNSIDGTNYEWVLNGGNINEKKHS